MTHLTLPVIAPCSLMEGRSIRAVLTLGALDAQLGKAFLLCPETGTTEVHRMALKSDVAFHTSVTRVI